MSTVQAVLIDLGGSIRRKVEEPLSWRLGPAGILEPLDRAIHRIAKDYPTDMADLVGAGLAVPGHGDWEKGISISFPRVSGWRDVPLRARVEEWAGVPVSLVGYASALARSEQFRLADPEPQGLVVIEVEENIATGIVVHGRVLEGTTGNAGELAHITVDPSGAVCHCGNTGCLETAATCQTVVEAMRKSGLPEEDQSITYQRVIELGRAGDAFVLRLLGRVARTLGIGVAAAINLLAPEVLILKGKFFDAGDLVMEPLTRAVRDRAFPTMLERLRIEPSTLGPESPALGAGLTAIEVVLQGAARRGA